MTASTEQERAECRAAYEKDFCPYKGNPDPWVVWQAAWIAARRAPVVPQGHEQKTVRFMNAVVAAIEHGITYQRKPEELIKRIGQELNLLLLAAAPQPPEAPTRQQIEQYLYEQDVVTVSREVAAAAGLARLAGKMQAAPVVLQELREAAQAVVERFDAPNWKDLPATGDYIARLRIALAAAPKHPETAPNSHEWGCRANAFSDCTCGEKMQANMMKMCYPLGAAALQTPEAEKQACWCETCRPLTVADMRFIVCPDCGNKRCPKAKSHLNTCTNSNAPGQKGSSWEHVKAAQASRITEICAQMCESRASSLVASGQATAANEAKKCASVLRNPPDAWREKLLAAQEQSK